MSDVKYLFPENLFHRTCIILLQEGHMTLPVELPCSFLQVSQVLHGQTFQHQLLVPGVQADPHPGHLRESQTPGVFTRSFQHPKGIPVEADTGPFLKVLVKSKRSATCTVYVYISLSLHLSISLSTYPSSHLSIYQSINLSIYLIYCIYTYIMYMYIYIYIYTYT